MNKYCVIDLSWFHIGIFADIICRVKIALNITFLMVCFIALHIFLFYGAKFHQYFEEEIKKYTSMENDTEEIL